MMTDLKERIVGVGGLPRSGKDTFAELLIEHGYYGFSFGDYNRNYSRERHKDKPDPISVVNMTETSNWLRETYGPDVILQAALREFREERAQGADFKGLVLYSIRAPIEVDWILSHAGELVWVAADDAVRHERGLQHLRDGEATITLEEFKSQEALQWKPQPGIAVEAQMDLSYVQSHATHTLHNNGSDLAEFQAKAQELIQKLS